jgi:hypothetical protein
VGRREDRGLERGQRVEERIEGCRGGQRAVEVTAKFDIGVNDTNVFMDILICFT